jgi:hypothetical protein
MFWANERQFRNKISNPGGRVNDGRKRIDPVHGSALSRAAPYGRDAHKLSKPRRARAICDSKGEQKPMARERI